MDNDSKLIFENYLQRMKAHGKGPEDIKDEVFIPLPSPQPDAAKAKEHAETVFIHSIQNMLGKKLDTWRFDEGEPGQYGISAVMTLADYQKLNPQDYKRRYEDAENLQPTMKTDHHDEDFEAVARNSAAGAKAITSLSEMKSDPEIGSDEAVSNILDNAIWALKRKFR